MRIFKCFPAKFFLILLTCAALFSIGKLVPTASAASSGTCGTDLVWALDDSGTLTISGSGDMYNYSNGYSPWYNQRSSIKAVIIEDTVTSIGDYAFRGCSDLISIDLGGVTSIGIDAVAYCSMLSTVDLSNVTSIEDWAFCYSGITSANLDKVTSLGTSAFYKCTKLSSVDIENITSFGSRAFYGCSSLTELDLGNVVSIADRAFESCTALESIHLPNTLRSIGKYSFSDCTNLTHVTIPDSLTTINTGCFYGCTALSSVEMGNSVKVIGQNAFRYCSSLETIQFPNTLVTFGNSAFSNSGLTSLSVPQNMIFIGASAFYNCQQLTSVSLPSCMEDIRYNAFSCCTNLKDIYFDGTTRQWKSIAIADGNSCLTDAALHTLCDGAKTRQVYTYMGDDKHRMDKCCTYCGDIVYSETQTCEDIDDEVSCYLCGVVGSDLQIHIAGSNMTLGNELTLNFMILAEDIQTDKEYTAVLTQSNNDEPLQIPSSDWGSMDAYLFVSYPLAAKEMTDEISIEIVDETGRVYNVPYSTSIRTYAHKLLDSDASDDAKTLAVDMLNYGASAQQKFRYNLDDPANSNLTAEQQQFATKHVDYRNDRFMDSNVYGSNLTLENRILLNVFFKDITDVACANIMFTSYNGVSQSITVPVDDISSMKINGQTLYKVSVNDIVLADAKQTVTVVLLDANGKLLGICTDSVESYVARAAAVDTGDLYINILKFAASAYTYLTTR